MEGPLLRRYDVAIERLDPAHQGLVIAHITDVHVGLMTPARKIRRAVALANSAKPDVVVLTGDYLCYSKRHVEAVGELLSGLEARSGVVATLGNHDHWTDAEGCARALQHNGYDVLRNQNVTLRPRGVPLRVVGIDDAVTRHHDPSRAFAGVTAGGTVVTLTHCPEQADHAAARGAQLVVAGHTHGGQVHVRRLSERVYRRLSGKRYLGGWYEVGRSVLYVNRGVGSSSIPLRAGEGGRSEVAVFTLKAA